MSAYRNLGRSGLRVSAVCVGGSNFGWTADEPASHAILDAALEHGVNFFDTADAYSDGASEAIIGRWLARDPLRRERVVLSTKLYYDTNGGFASGDPAFESFPNAARLSAKHIRHACEQSLRRLQTDYIDVYQMHQFDASTPLDEIWQALDLLITQGKVLYAGASNFAAWQIVAANEAAARQGTRGVISAQSHHNLMIRAVELEVLPACEAYGVGALAYSPLAHGILGGVLGADAGRRRRGSAGAAAVIERHRERIERWEALCADLGHPPGQVAVAWLLSGRVPVTPILGPRTAHQLVDVLGALDVRLDDATMARLDEIWPGPGGPAPDAYRFATGTHQGPIAFH